MNAPTSNGKWIRRSVGVLLLILLGYLLFNALPILLVLTANILYLAVLGIGIIALIYLFYRLFR